MKQKLFNSGIFFGIGIVAGFFVIMMQIPNLSEEITNKIIDELGQIEILYIVGALQIGILSGVLSFLGQLMLPKTGFVLFPKLEKKTVLMAISIGALGAIVIIISDALVFKRAMETINPEYSFSFIYFLSSILYGGIIEEMIMRLFLLTGIVFILQLITKKRSNTNVLIAILLSSILFGVGHLPAMALLTDLTAIIILRTILINLIPAIGFGYLYVKKGLSYSIIAHIMTHVVLQLLLGPILL